MQVSETIYVHEQPHVINEFQKTQLQQRVWTMEAHTKWDTIILGKVLVFDVKNTNIS
jgi:hypothetical protein